MTDEDRIARTSVTGEGATLEVAFDPEGTQLAVRYRVGNTGDAPLAVFDRGDRHAVMTKRIAAGEVPDPHFDANGEALTLTHAARPLPQPSPTVPPVPLAARLDAGQQFDGAFSFDLSLAAEARRVRWCLGVLPFDEEGFREAASAGEVPVWSAPFSAAETQQMLCTPWFDIAEGSFAQE